MDYERILRRIRNSDVLFGSRGDAKEDQAERIIRKCKVRLAPQWRERAAQVNHQVGQRLLRTFA